MTALISQAATSFGAGVLSSLSPCVYPMLPISVAFFGSQVGRGRRRQILLFFVGQVITFTFLGMAAVWLGQIFGFSSESRTTNIVIGGVLIFFGIISFRNWLPSFLQNSKFQNFPSLFNREGLHPLVTSFLIGAGSALVASPCTSPILGTVLMSLSQSTTFAHGMVLMVSYALGISALFLALGLGIVHAKKLPRSGPWLGYVHTLSGALIVLAGVFYIYRGIF